MGGRSDASKMELLRRDRVGQVFVVVGRTLRRCLGLEELVQIETNQNRTDVEAPLNLVVL